MTFISYAQNYEDVMLWRALKHVEKGFYVDVGANDPIADSVTQAFYEKGWRGINVEPMQSYIERLRNLRALDINLPIAVAERQGECVFYEIADSGNSTLRPDVAQMQRQAGHLVLEKTVSVLTLNQVLEKNCHSEIHFLKIDVEGAEKQVLQGLNLTRWRPWILVIEATLPNSSTSNYEEWQDLVLAANYLLVYFDGLNRFYLAREHSDLADTLKTPPNYFDDFVPVNLVNALAEGAWLRSQLKDIQIELDQVQSERDSLKTIVNDFDHFAPVKLEKALADITWLNGQLKDIQIKLDQIRAERDSLKTRLDITWAEKEVDRLELERVLHSRSQRITAPLRAVIGGLRIVRARSNTRLDHFLRWLAGTIYAQPGLKTNVVEMLNRFPGFKLSLKKRIGRQENEEVVFEFLSDDLNGLTVHGRKVYHDLREALGQNRNGK